MPKENLKDKVDGNELDLSLNNLTSLPIKDLAALPRATNLDLSCNLLDVLPDTFCTLTHLVKIDLSKNRLTSLPDDFGNLRKLQHLDLLGNKLTLLPYSMYQMTKLKWLDLKDNPLEKEIKQVAGDCLDEKQCQKCATDIVSYMKIWHGRLEKKKQKELEEQKKSAAMREAQEEEERQRLQEERKKRKQEKKQAQKVKKQASPEKPERASGAKASAGTSKSTPQKTGGRSSITQCCLTLFFWLFLTLGLVLLAFTGLLVFCQNDPKHNVCEVVQYEVTIVPFMKIHVVPHIESGQKYAQELVFGTPVKPPAKKAVVEKKNVKTFKLKAEDMEKLKAKAGGSLKGVKLNFNSVKGKNKVEVETPTKIVEPSVQEPSEPLVQEPSKPSVPEPLVQEPSVQEPSKPSVPEPSVQEPLVQEPSVQEPSKPSVPQTKRLPEEHTAMAAEKRRKRLTSKAPEMTNTVDQGSTMTQAQKEEAERNGGFYIPRIARVAKNKTCKSKSSAGTCNQNTEKKKSCQANPNSNPKPKSKPRKSFKKPSKYKSPIRSRMGSKFKRSMSSSSTKGGKKPKKGRVRKDWNGPKPWSLEGRLAKGKANRREAKEQGKNTGKRQKSSKKCSKRK